MACRLEAELHLCFNKCLHLICTWLKMKSTVPYNRVYIQKYSTFHYSEVWDAKSRDFTHAEQSFITCKDQRIASSLQVVINTHPNLNLCQMFVVVSKR